MNKIVFDIPRETAKSLERSLYEIANSKKRIAFLIEESGNDVNILNSEVFIRELSRYYDAYLECGVILGMLKNSLLQDKTDLLMSGFNWQIDSENALFTVFEK